MYTRTFWDRLKCWLGLHEWECCQETFLTDGSYAEPVNRKVAICWRQCQQCAASKLVHILK